MKKFVIVILYIRGAGGSGCHHRPVLRKVLDKLPSYGFGFLPESAVESHLPATGLVGVIMYLMTQLLKDPDHIKSRLRIKLINETWNEDVDGHGNYLKSKNSKIALGNYGL
jgi:hypothetical protein